MGTSTKPAAVYDGELRAGDVVRCSCGMLATHEVRRFMPSSKDARYGSWKKDPYCAEHAPKHANDEGVMGIDELPAYSTFLRERGKAAAKVEATVALF